MSVYTSMGLGSGFSAAPVSATVLLAVVPWADCGCDGASVDASPEAVEAVEAVEVAVATAAAAAAFCF